MADFDALLRRSRQQVMNPQRTTGDIIRAGIQATTGTPYREALADIEQNKFDRALRGYQVLSSERQFATEQEQRAYERSRDEREFQARQEQQMWERAQAEAERGDANLQTLLDMAKSYGTNAADQHRLVAAVIARTEGEDINDATRLPLLINEEAARLELPGRTDAPELKEYNVGDSVVTFRWDAARAEHVPVFSGSRWAGNAYTDYIRPIFGKIEAGEPLTEADNRLLSEYRRLDSLDQFIAAFSGSGGAPSYRVVTQEDYDRVPSGEKYLNANDNQVYTKP